MKVKALLGATLLLVVTGTVHAGWLDTVVERAGKKLGERGVNDAGNAGYDAAKGTVKGKPAETKAAARQSPASAGAADDDVASGKPSSRKTANETPAGASTLAEAETVYSKFDFIPGDKTIFSDDFSDTDVGEFPRKWTLEGPKPGANNTVDVVEYQGRRFLRSVPGAKGQPPATQYLRLDQKRDFPEKFTIEFDAVLAPVKEGSVYHLVYRVLFVPTDKKVDVFKWNAPNSVLFSGKESSSANTKTVLALGDGKVHHFAVSVNGTFVKAYIDNQRVVNDPDALKRPLKQIGLQMLTPNNFATGKLLFTNFRLAEGGKDVKSALDTDGKIVTHGILFDTGKDTIKPESLPTLKSILAILNDDPGLKFSIEGHTDSQGSKALNQPLSEKRSAAVMNWLTGKGIDQSRLATKGLGDTVPIDTNKTPEGRANNRRVEFVKF